MFSAGGRSLPNGCGSPEVVTVSGFPWSADDLPEILPGFLVGSWSALMISAVADGLPVLGSAGADLAGAVTCIFDGFASLGRLRWGLGLHSRRRSSAPLLP